MVAQLTPELLTSQTPPKESDEQPAPTRGARLRAAPALQIKAGFWLYPEEINELPREELLRRLRWVRTFATLLVIAFFLLQLVQP